jgi:protease-4
VQVKLGLLPDPVAAAALSSGLTSGLAGGVARDLGWLSQVAARRQPFAAVTHCLCEAP